jgi:hypothetical protein
MPHCNENKRKQTVYSTGGVNTVLDDNCCYGVRRDGRPEYSTEGEIPSVFVRGPCGFQFQAKVKCMVV